MKDLLPRHELEKVQRSNQNLSFCLSPPHISPCLPLLHFLTPKKHHNLSPKRKNKIKQTLILSLSSFSLESQEQINYQMSAWSIPISRTILCNIVSYFSRKFSGMGRRNSCFQDTFVSFFVFIALVFHQEVICQEDRSLDNPAANRLYNQFVFDKISNLTEVFEDDIKRELGFCITNVLVSKKILISKPKITN